VTTSRLNSGGNFLGMASILPWSTAPHMGCQPNPRQTRAPWLAEYRPARNVGANVKARLIPLLRAEGLL